MSSLRRRFTYRRRLSEDDRVLWRSFMIAHARMIRMLDEELRTDHGLDLASFEVLYELTTAPENQLRMAELADLLLYTRGGVTASSGGSPTAATSSA